ncbi:MAG: isoprenylcysteine carboxylmethyltransferase family protein [Beijerinckiaceae bacterium]|nr:isoprenylcysteine carboxylmethyltransferase family protein [Beijerinckiaceae bacterium]
MNVLENRLPPPILCLLIALAMWGGNSASLEFVMDDRLRITVAIVVLAFAFIVGFSAIRAFRQARTTINPVDIEAASSLVTDGIFRYTRNPMYVSLAALLTGLAILLATPIAFLGPVAFVLYIWRFQIVPEERVMQLKFGKSYADYKTRVRRWL